MLGIGILPDLHSLSIGPLEGFQASAGTLASSTVASGVAKLSDGFAPGLRGFPSLRRTWGGTPRRGSHFYGSGLGFSLILSLSLAR